MGKSADDKAERLAVALRENLLRRKARTRALPPPEDAPGEDEVKR